MATRTAEVMHVHFVGEADDGISVSSHHARALFEVGYDVSFAPADGPHRGDLNDVDVIHLVTREQLSTRLFRRLVAARVSGIPMIRFWTGTDVLWAIHHPPTRMIAISLQKLGVLQHCRSQRMAEQLASIEIDAKVGPVVDPNLSDRAQPEPFPSQFTALCYMPSDRRTFCGGEIIDKLIGTLPELRFLILGDTATDYTEYNNVESVGHVENITRTILRSTVVLQPRLDGALSRLCLEALSHGRYVIGSHAWPHCHFAETAEEYVRFLRELKRESFNLDGRPYVCGLYDKRPSVSNLCDLLKQLTEQSIFKRGVLGGWLGVAAILRSTALLTAKEFDPPDPDDCADDLAFQTLLSQSPRPIPT